MHTRLTSVSLNPALSERTHPCSRSADPQTTKLGAYYEQLSAGRRRVTTPAQARVQGMFRALSVHEVLLRLLRIPLLPDFPALVDMLLLVRPLPLP